MRYFLDTEFNGYQGELLTLALVREDAASLYLGVPLLRVKAPIDPWVLQNVIPVAARVPAGVKFIVAEDFDFPELIASFLHGDDRPTIITDWPDDIRYFCAAVMTGPGYMADIPSLAFEMHRVDAYPTEVPGAIQHNAYWDAMALREKLLYA